MSDDFEYQHHRYDVEKYLEYDCDRGVIFGRKKFGAGENQRITGQAKNKWRSRRTTDPIYRAKRSALIENGLGKGGVPASVGPDGWSDEGKHRQFHEDDAAEETGKRSAICS